MGLDDRSENRSSIESGRHLWLRPDTRRFGRKIVRTIRSLGRPYRNLLGPALTPTFLIIGTQKGGTTSLFIYLSGHPGIAAPQQKEVDFFGCPTRHERGSSFYHSHFPRRRLHAGQLSFEASPHYLADTRAAHCVHAYLPSMKLIALLRDPVERAHSAWNMYRRNFQRNREWFYDWVRRCDASTPRQSFVPRTSSFGQDFELDIRDELDALEQGRTIEMPVVSAGFYAMQLNPYLDHFPAEQILVERSEDLLNDPIAVLRRTEEFLGLNPFSWDRSRLRPEYAGTYTRPMPVGARHLLEAVYEEPNRRLAEILGTGFGWS